MIQDIELLHPDNFYDNFMNKDYFTMKSKTKCVAPGSGLTVSAVYQQA